MGSKYVSGGHGPFPGVIDEVAFYAGRETRRLARQVLRLTRVQTGVLSSADVGDDVG